MSATPPPAHNHPHASAGTQAAGAVAAGTQAPAAVLDAFQWKPQPAAWNLVVQLVDAFLEACPKAKELAERMHTDTATRFVDWVDTIELSRTPALRDRMLKCGYELRSEPGAAETYHNPLGIFPRIVLRDSTPTRVWVKVEYVTDFLSAQGLLTPAIVGEVHGQMRYAVAFKAPNAEMLVVERHGFRGLVPPVYSPSKAMLAEQHRDRLRRRQRDFSDDICGFEALWSLLDAAIADIGVDWTCDIFFACEREYWMRRNHAARVQFARQQSLGLGWANHDHHTYRCGRDNFRNLMKTWLKLGFQARERFYAGIEAGWGAQVMEQPATGITTFNDVDLSPEELCSDYFNEPLPPQSSLKTVGLWCGLHGDSLLLAGMHHLEAVFNHDLLVKQLDAGHVHTMAPFTTFPYLKQAFTEGQRWQVSAHRLQRLLDMNLITPAQADAFRREGAIGSHLENLERNDGFKGFNQQGVSDIIARTDPRRLI